MAILHFFSLGIACKQSLLDALAAGGKGGRVCKYVSLWNLNSPVAPRRVSCQISANQREAETSANENKHWKHVPRVMTSLLMSSPSNQLCASNFSMQIFKIRWRSCKLSLSFPATPPERHGELARRLVLEDQSLRLDGLWRLREWSII